MEKQPRFISVCNQKGGVGKSTLTILLASLLHYRYGRSVLVVDCDYPQWSIHTQRARELEIMDRTPYYKLMMIRQYKATGQKIWPCIPSRPDNALQEIQRFTNGERHNIDIVLFDLPGTAATAGVLGLIAQVEYLFIPCRADKIVMESGITLARTAAEAFIPNPKAATRGAYLFWTMIDGRERTGLYEQYEKALALFDLPVLASRIPARSRFCKEIGTAGGPPYRSTLFAPERSFAADAHLDCLAEEILRLIDKTSA